MEHVHNKCTGEAAAADCGGPEWDGRSPFPEELEEFHTLYSVH